jgi:two-component system sensor histidine kinase BaeS
MFRRLSVRIALILAVIGPVLIIAIGLIASFYIMTSLHGPGWRLLQLGTLIVLVPLILGTLAARLVTEPLARLRDGITALKDGRGRIKLPPSELKEFDTIVDSFNQLSEQLHQEETLRKSLISDTAHELNTPLTAIIGQLEGMRAGLIKKDTSHVELLLEQANRLNDVAQGLLEYARVQSRALQPDKQAVNLKAVVTRLTQTHDADLLAKHISLQATFPPSTTILADKRLLEQALDNLITNAIRYSGGHTITIACTDTVLSVSDDGNGVPAASLPHLFERFYRVEQSRNRNTGGLGLGMAIVSEIALAHDWSVQASNTSPGLQITFMINSHEQA